MEIFWKEGRKDDTAHFVLYRGASKTGPFEEIARPASGETSFVDKTAEPGTVYYYSLTAIDAAGNESPRSEIVFGRY